MKTWEMIKELTENPKKKFVSSKGQPNNEMTASMFQNNIAFAYTNKSHVEYVSVTRTWEEVKTPVTFMEAVESRKCVKVEHELIKNLYSYHCYRRIHLLMSGLADDFTGLEFAEILENGKWYIED